jgi:hypothetical protein
MLDVISGLGNNLGRQTDIPKAVLTQLLTAEPSAQSESSSTYKMLYFLWEAAGDTDMSTVIF